MVKLHTVKLWKLSKRTRKNKKSPEHLTIPDLLQMIVEMCIIYTGYCF